MSPKLTVRFVTRQGFTLIELLVVIAIIAILAAIIIPAVMRVQIQAANAKDLEQVRGIGTAFTLYNKRYSYYPAMCNMSDPVVVNINTPRVADTPKGIAMKLLVLGGYVEDVKVFFSPRETQPTVDTLTKIQQERDPKKASAEALDWASTYSYDSGHNPFHGITPMFGSRLGYMQQIGETAHVLTCEQIAKEVVPDASTHWILGNHKTATTVSLPDDIYADDSAALDWRDCYLAEPARTGY